MLTIAQAREAFEKWAAGWHYEPFERLGAGYKDRNVQKCWRAWCHQHGIRGP